MWKKCCCSSVRGVNAMEDEKGPVIRLTMFCSFCCLHLLSLLDSVFVVVGEV